MPGARPRRYLSLEADAPPGFEHVAAPTRAQLRGAIVAVWTREPAVFEAGLGPLRDKLRGVILCPGEARRQTPLGPTLWRVEVSEAGASALAELADAWLAPFTESIELRDTLGHCELELERERMDRALLVDKLDRETRSLRDLLVARTQWTIEAMAALVSFSVEGVAGVGTSRLPARIVEFLVSEPLALTGAGMWLARGGGWERAAQAGRLGAIALPDPREVTGIIQPTPTTLLSCFEIASADGGARECVVAVERTSALDEADTSFFALFTEQIVALHRDRALAEALAQAIARKDALIAELSTPIIQIAHDMVCLPIIGSVGGERAAQITTELLDAVARRGIRAVIIDLTGVTTMSTDTVHGFSGLVRAIGLLGARCMVTGISPAVAQALVGLGVELGAIETMPSVRAALAAWRRSS